MYGRVGVILVTFLVFKKKHTCKKFFRELFFDLNWVWHKLAACLGLIEKKIILKIDF